MANSRRVEKFAALIRREVSDILKRSIKDELIQKTIITITEVEVSNDLQYCKVFFSNFDQNNRIDLIQETLNSSTGFIKGEVARRLQMRRAPEIIFKLDKRIEKGDSVLNLLGQLEKARESKISHVSFDEL